MKKNLLLPLIACALCSGSARAAEPDAERDRARTLFLEGKARFGEGEFERAIAAFVAAGRLRPSPLLDYNIARCHEQLGARQQAIRHYRRYLIGRPDAANRGAVRARIGALRRELQTLPRESNVYDDLETRAGAAATSAAASQPAVSQPASQPAAAAPTSKPAKGAGPAEALLPHEAALGRTGPPSPYGPYAPYRPVKRRRVPFYKHWSFWVGVGAAALIGGVIVGIAVSQANEGSSVSPDRTLTLPLNF